MYNKTHIHFMGIGGIGMSGIAKILTGLGYTVSGCDSDHTQKSITDLQALGCTIGHGNNTRLCKDTSIDVLVYSSAIPDTHPEVSAAQLRGIPTIPRAAMLAEIMRTKYSIAVSGAHGKTTVTSLIAHILLHAQLDPTVIVGGHLQALSTNAHLGNGSFLVAEADESDRSFLQLYPTLAVVTNINLEHLETYTDIEDIKNSFKEFMSHVPFYGKSIVCGDDPHIRSLLPLHRVKTITYGTEQQDLNFYAADIELETDHSTCTVYEDNKLLGQLTIAMPGKHNVLNALGALATARQLKVSFEHCAQALSSFKGIARRFSSVGTFKGAEIIDDYGHHPTEILNTLLVARKRTHNKLIVLFQPHRYSRTEQLWDDFVHLFAYSNIDELIITDIYAASENPKSGISSQELVAAIKEKHPTGNVRYLPYQEQWDDVRSFLALTAQEDDIILLQGAGKVTQLGPLLQS